MIMYSMISSFCFILLFAAVHMTDVKDPKNFGPYDVSYPRYELCRGPKSRNLTSLSLKLAMVGDSCYGFFNITFLEQIHGEDIKIVVYSLKNNSKTLLWTYKIKDPCKHFAFSSVIRTFFKSNQCDIDKGSYSSSMNFNDVCNAFLGNSFFYGEYMLKANGTTKRGNVVCLIIVIKFDKKSEGSGKKFVC